MKQQETGSWISSGGSLVQQVPTSPLLPPSPVCPPLYTPSELQLFLRHFLCPQSLGKQKIIQLTVTKKNTDNKTKKPASTTLFVLSLVFNLCPCDGDN